VSLRARSAEPPVSYVPDLREQEAYDEIARTRISPSLASWMVAGFLVLLATGPALETLAVAGGRSQVVRPLAGPSAPGVAAALDALRGSIAELELRFDERSELVRRVRPWVQAALFRFARYGNERAYVGRDGWLVFRPDFDHLTSRRAGAALVPVVVSTTPSTRVTRAPRTVREGDPVATIVDFRDQLAARGIALVLLPAPVKPTIHSESLAAAAGAAPLVPPRQTAILDAVAAAGVEVLDPSASLARRAAGGTPTYLLADTHWRPETLDAVARELAIALRAGVELPTGDAARWREEQHSVEGLGDTAVLLDLPPPVARSLREQVDAARVVAADGSPWRSTSGAPVLLLGDSFSAVFSQPDLGWGSGAGLAERLSFHLGLPVDRILRNAGGASATREVLADELTDDPTRLDGVAVVVWELAARELTQGAWRPVTLPASGAR
jgi:SGNH hydrolase-like domain, acetyltransferase AlgX